MSQLRIMKCYRDLYDILIKPDIEISCGCVGQNIPHSVILTVVDKLIKLVEKFGGNGGVEGFASLIFSLVLSFENGSTEDFLLKDLGDAIDSVVARQ